MNLEVVETLAERRRARDRKRYWDNPEKHRARARKWREDNPERARASASKWKRDNPERRKVHDRKRLYGITEKQYNEILNNQNGVCAICGSSAAGWKHNVFHVDHCHDTGEVRGLLCQHCNIGIGNLRDNSELLRKAANYIEKHKERRDGV